MIRKAWAVSQVRVSRRTAFDLIWITLLISACF
jgi:hypothetical protein